MRSVISFAHSQIIARVLYVPPVDHSRRQPPSPSPRYVLADWTYPSHANFSFSAVLAYFAPDRPRASARSSPTHLAAALRFDRFIAALSFFTDATANALVVLAPTSSQALFIMFTSLNSITSGGNPALHSLGAVAIQAMGKGNEIGLVFGALGLVNAVAHIIAVRTLPSHSHSRLPTDDDG